MHSLFEKCILHFNCNVCLVRDEFSFGPTGCCRHAICRFVCPFILGMASPPAGCCTVCAYCVFLFSNNTSLTMLTFGPLVSRILQPLQIPNSKNAPRLCILSSGYNVSFHSCWFLQNRTWMRAQDAQAPASASPLPPPPPPPHSFHMCSL